MVAMYMLILKNFDDKYLNELPVQIDTLWGSRFRTGRPPSSPGNLIIAFEIENDACMAERAGKITMSDGTTFRIERFKNLEPIGPNELIDVQWYQGPFSTLSEAADYDFMPDGSSLVQTNPERLSLEFEFLHQLTKSPEETEELKTVQFQLDSKYTNLLKNDINLSKLSPDVKLKFVNVLPGKFEITYVSSLPYDVVEMKIKSMCQHSRIQVNDKTILNYLLKDKKNLKSVRDLNQGMVDIQESLEENDGHCALDLTTFGTKIDLDEAEKKLREIINGVQCEKVDLSSMEQIKNLDLIVEGLEARFDCKIDHSSLKRNDYDTAVKEVGYVGSTEISIISAPIEKQKANILVNSVAKSLDLNHGDISRSLLKEAGDGLQEACKNLPKLESGEILETSSFKLNSNKVYHCSLHAPNMVQNLEKVVRGCMEKASGDKFESIAFPPLCCGVLRMECSKAAKIILRSIKTFIEENPETTLKFVRIAIANDTNDTKLNNFIAELKKLKLEKRGSLNAHEYKFKIAHSDSQALKEIADKLKSIL